MKRDKKVTMNESDESGQPGRTIRAALIQEGRDVL